MNSFMGSNLTFEEHIKMAAVGSQEHLAILKRGVDNWNKWRADNPEIRPRLAYIDLTLANLRYADFSRTDFSHTKLCRADLTRANFTLADLKWADLSEANLTWTDFHWANLGSSHFNRARIDHAVFTGIYMQTVKGLETVQHSGPSAIGIDTMYMSEGEIPEAFLRGAGVPDTFISYMQSLIGKGLQLYSCFISYSSKDQEFAERLHADLQARGVRCWFAPQDAKGGKKLHEQIEQAIRIYEKLLLIVSRDSMQSNWVNTEIYNARQRELTEGRQMFFPVSLVPFSEIQKWRSFDADSGKDLAREIREYYIPDFSNWKDHDSYQKTLDRLLRDLKAEKPSAPSR